MNPVNYSGDVVEKEEIVPVEVLTIFDAFSFENLAANVMSDCFKALSVAILKEFMMSSDSKVLLFQSMLANLEKMGYSENMIQFVREGMNKVIKKIATPNSFMG